MVIFSEMFVSELIGNSIVDKVQKNIGRVKDIIITMGDSFPKITGLSIIVDNNNKRKNEVLLIGEIDNIGKQFISTRSVKERVVFTALREGEVLLMRDVIDQQVVDLDGARLIRVNDLKLAQMDQDIRLIAADIGIKGMLRRLGLEKPIGWILGLFQKNIPDQLIGWDHVQNLKGGKICVPSKAIPDLHPADIAQIISQVKSNDKTAILSAISDKTAAEALHELEPMLAAVLINNLDTKKALSILEKMPADEVADILGDLTKEKAEELLRLIRVRKASQIQKLLKHKDETAGGLMTTEFISLPQNLTVEEVIMKLREIAPDAETIYYLYIVDDQERLAGVLSLRSLIVSPPQKPISEIFLRNCITVRPEINQREVALIISKYNLLAVPVVDSENKILGIVTVDDVMNFILPPISRRKKQALG